MLMFGMDFNYGHFGKDKKIKLGHIQFKTNYFRRLLVIIIQYSIAII